jgi:predicted DNA-binding transcriptional regulator AlpA
MLGFHGKQRVHRGLATPTEGPTMDGRCISQNELAQRWQVSESTLERWRAERIGPSFLKLGGQVRYRLMDIMAFEDQTLQVMAHQKPALDYPKQQLRQPHRSL